MEQQLFWNSTIIRLKILNKFSFCHFIVLATSFILIEKFALANGKNSSTSNGKLMLNKFSLLDENTFIEESLFPENDFRCGSIVNLTTKYGFVKNPHYPNSYKVPIVCQWNIIGTSPDEIITISIDELDIENPNEHSKYCIDSIDSKQCCTVNYLRIQSLNSDRYFCGKSIHSASNVYISETNFVSVIFNATLNQNNAVGFYFSYFITPKSNTQCYANEFHCLNDKCIPKKWKCNNKNECGDGSDEMSCDLTSDFIKCDNDDSMGYYHISKRCDNKIDCENRSDELNCTYCDSNQFRCLSPQSLNKCINLTLLCNGIPDCQDFSDETKCNHCPSKKIRCGTMNHCYDPKLHRCNRILDCPNGADELNCFEHCKGKIMCASGDGCYDLEERCNGIVQCADYSDEKNCTLELCRPDKGSFLCTNGRCIPSIWTCDRSADCYDGSDEMRCLKNSVITAAIIGSLICGLLIVIAISCGCKLVALRHLEQYRTTMATNVSNPAPFRNMDFPFPSSGDLDASLFRLEHSVLFREPPPSYASTMGGYHDVNGINNSYMDQYRRYRRQRRCRRMLRRQHRNAQQQQSVVPINTSTNLVINPSHSNDHLNDQPINSPTSETTIDINSIAMTENTPTAHQDYFRQIEDPNSKKKEVLSNDEEIIDSNSDVDHNHIQSIIVDSINTQQHSNNSGNQDNLNIELEPIPHLNNFDCDSQPLINR
ncbi:Low-density lipoprotein receptor- protein 12 [Dermatophagoides farinae]|uniref:Low-density lipoprotein receptor- protein 12 n=1 Tax=Dermatophagoides farinae TaxID=6954 RepID=A0A922LBC4_DERFA|nr:low-density lipoprotein receptor-related protein 12-like [Dermatophagoides farinae]KAH7642193.1 low-density lipoprotein receptor-like protein [Dermatophagoides farinae]KAH9529343.1 Low-density lipoprotein receptor- protein 12 [Dermatophagoides farinae]